MTMTGKRYNISLGTDGAAERAGVEIVRRLQAAGHAAFLVGGCVRDRLLGRPVADVDVATDAVPAKVQALFPRTYAVGAAFGVVVVHTDSGEDVEVATFREERGYADGRHPDSVSFSTPEADAARRDFTINALFYDPDRQQVVDYVNGFADLERGVVRAIGDAPARFGEDALRLMRAVRFVAELGFDLDPATARAMPPLAGTLARISTERIYSELLRMLQGRDPQRAFALLQELGLLSVCLPELSAMVGVQQPAEFHPEGDVWVHTLALLAGMRQPAEALAWAVLLHDVGKPPTYEFRDGRERFPGHADHGEDMSRGILGRLHASREVIDAVAEMVGNHMTFAAVQEMRPSTLRRFMGRPTFRDELELHRLDCMASHGYADNYVFCLDELAKYANEPVLPEPLVRGGDVLALGLLPGPEVGRLLREASEQQLNGQLADRAQALAWLRQRVQAGSRE